VTVDADLDVRLLDVLRAATGRPGLAYASEPVPLTGGFWAELLAFSLADPPPGWPRELVARVMPDAGVARKETIVQEAVSAAGFPTPVVRASGGPDDGLGRAFMVMDRATGATLLPGLTGAGALTAGLRQAAAQIPEALGSAMAALHALDPRSVREQLGPDGDVPVTLPGMLRNLLDAATHCQREDLARAARWLIDHPRPLTPEVICHGDLHPFNVLAVGAQLTVLDWSACLLAPRAYDVAFTTSMLSDPPVLLPAPLRPLVRRAGRLLAGRFIRRYEAHAGVFIGTEDVRWHRAVVSVRALVEVACWIHDGVIDNRAGHPWLVSGPALAAHLTTVTGVTVRPL
jgi:aminoglycoside phosphotransferase (APT) family kinase protein